MSCVFSYNQQHTPGRSHVAILSQGVEVNPRERTKICLKNEVHLDGTFEHVYVYIYTYLNIRIYINKCVDIVFIPLVPFSLKAWNRAKSQKNVRVRPEHSADTHVRNDKSNSHFLHLQKSGNENS